MDPKHRFLYFAILIGLALAIPYLLAPENPEPERAAEESAAPQPEAAQASPGEPAPEAPARDAPAMDPAARRAAQRELAIETPEFEARVSNLNGGLTSFELRGDRFRDGKAPLEMVTTDKEPFLPLAIDVAGLPAEAPATWDMERVSDDTIRLSGESGGVHITRKLEAGQGPYQLWVTTRVQNRSAEPQQLRFRLATHHYVTREAEGATIPLLPVRSAATSQTVCRHNGELDRLTRDDLQLPQSFGGAISFSGVENVYFLSAVAPESNAELRCVLESSARGRDDEGQPLGTLYSARIEHTEVELAPGAGETYRFLAYLGPKSPDELAAAGHELKEAIESGWFTTLAEWLTWLLSFIHEFVGNWGVAIILLTFVVKLVLYPLTARQMHSMAKMKELKPELDRINELYGDDREKKGAAIMELYRKRGVNPMAGCFPVLLQLPIWFSLYASLSSNVELFRAPFALWWTDLSSPDPYFVLPLALGLLMYVQQKISPATGMDPVQQKVMLYMMPAMITVFMLFLPAGLCLYMFTNSALSIVQQRVIEARLSSATSAAAAPEPERSDPPRAESEPSAISTLSPSRAQRGRPSKAERRLRRGKR